MNDEDSLQEIIKLKMAIADFKIQLQYMNQIKAKLQLSQKGLSEMTQKYNNCNQKLTNLTGKINRIAGENNYSSSISISSSIVADQSADRILDSISNFISQISKTNQKYRNQVSKLSLSIQHLDQKLKQQQNRQNHSNITIKQKQQSLQIKLHQKQQEIIELTKIIQVLKQEQIISQQIKKSFNQIKKQNNYLKIEIQKLNHQCLENKKGQIIKKQWMQLMRNFQTNQDQYLKSYLSKQMNINQDFDTISKRSKYQLLFNDD